MRKIIILILVVIICNDHSNGLPLKSGIKLANKLGLFKSLMKNSHAAGQKQSANSISSVLKLFNQKSLVKSGGGVKANKIVLESGRPAVFDPFEIYGPGYNPEGGAPPNQLIFGPVVDPFELYGTTWEEGQNVGGGHPIQPDGSYYSNGLNPDCF